MENKEKQNDLKIIKDVVQALDEKNEVFKLTRIILEAQEKIKNNKTEDKNNNT